MDRMEAQRLIATLHSFRFFGLVFIVPGVVSPALPASFAVSAAYGDFAAGVLAILALVVRSRPFFWFLVAAFNVVGAGDLVMNYIHAIQIGLPAMAGELGVAYAIPVIYVPLLMITHVAALNWLVRPRQEQSRTALRMKDAERSDGAALPSATSAKISSSAAGQPRSGRASADC